MHYEEVFLIFWEQVKESVQEGRFAKLTMAKTIGKPNLQNIFVRPLNTDDGFKVMLKFSYRSPETHDQEEAFVVLESHLVKSFSSVLLFTTTKDVMFKVNKKGVGSISEKEPTFRNIIRAERKIEGLERMD